MGHMAALELPCQEGRARSRGTRGSIRQTLCCRAQWLGVANDVLYDVSSVESSRLIALLH
jgi:hypothetical protein